MSAFSDLTTAVSKRILDDANTAVDADDVEQAINDAIEFRKSTEFWFNEFKEEVTLTADDAVITQPSAVDMLIPFTEGGLVISYNSQKYPVIKVDSDSFDAEDNGATGMPYIYTFRANQYEAYFTPDQAYTAIWRGLKDYDDLSESNGSNDWTTYASQLIKYDAISRLFNELLEDSDQADRFAALAEIELNKLLERTNDLKKTGELKVQSIL